jgi:hypothetical protein
MFSQEKYLNDYVNSNVRNQGQSSNFYKFEFVDLIHFPTHYSLIRFRFQYLAMRKNNLDTWNGHRFGFSHRFMSSKLHSDAIKITLKITLEMCVKIKKNKTNFFSRTINFFLQWINFLTQFHDSGITFKADSPWAGQLNLSNIFSSSWLTNDGRTNKISKNMILKKLYTHTLPAMHKLNCSLCVLWNIDQIKPSHSFRVSLPLPLSLSLPKFWPGGSREKEGEKDS